MVSPPNAHGRRNETLTHTSSGLFDLGFAYVEVGSITPEAQVRHAPSLHPSG